MCQAELPRGVQSSTPWVLSTSILYFTFVLLILSGPARGAFAPFLTLLIPIVLVGCGILVTYSVRAYLQKRREMRSLAIQREIYIRIRQ